MALRNIFISLCTATGFAQGNDAENPYYETFEDKLTLQLFTLSTSNAFVFNDSDLEYTVTPNIKETIGISVKYDIVAFSYGFAPKFFAANRDNKGSKMTSFNIDFFPGRFVQHLDFYHQKGVTIDAPAVDFSQYYDQVTTTKIGGSTAYMVNKNFSYKAIAFQNERQLISAGSFAPTLYYYYTDFASNGTPGIESGHYYDLAIAPAYYYNWVPTKNFLLSAGAALGIGINYTVDGDTHLTTMLYHGKVNLALGYNNERFFGGVHLKALYFEHGSESTQNIGDVIGYSTLFVGYRFDAPSFLEKEKDKIQQKLKK